jgi:acyl-CoA synthetase (AMP-forming)/AMP-acid ligase II
MRFKAMKPIWKKSWPPSWPHDGDDGVFLGKDPLFQVLYDNAYRFRSKPAMIYYGTVISYLELKDLMLKAAGALQRLGIAKGDRVYLGMQNCLHCLGAIVVPGNPMFKGGELSYVLNDSGAKVAIVENGIYPILAGVRDQLSSLQAVVATSLGEYLPKEPYPVFPTDISLEEGRYPDAIDWQDFIAAEPVKGFADVTMDDVAQLQYTSGTTGQPKGAMLTQRNITCRGAIDSRIRNDTFAEVHLAVLPLFHITGLANHVLSPFFFGGTVCILTRFDVESVLAAIERYRVSFMCSITTMDIALITHPNFKNYDISSIRIMTMGGAPLPPAIQQKFEEIGIRLAEGYGMSETTATMSWNPVERIKLGTVGPPNPHAEIRIADMEDMDQDVAPGQQGELWLRGAGVSIGYWNNPGATAESFPEGWIRTGDIASMDEDGYITLHGRLKELIKASGYSVFPAEVETYMYQHPAILECCVIGVPHEYRGEDVKAFVVLKPEWTGKVTVEELVAWAREKMAVYKYPRTIELRDELPKLASGKVLRRELKDQEIARLAAAEAAAQSEPK